MKTIELENITKSYSLSKKERKKEKKDVVFALKGVTFFVEAGRIFSILGPNGAGKTTTLRIISTIIEQSSGNIRLLGKNVQENKDDLRRTIGFLTNDLNLYERFTPNELLYFFSQFYGMEKSIFRERKEVLYSKLGIHDFAKKKIKDFSTGMKQKVSLARVLIHNPDILIFDEPTTGLDIIASKAILELIQEKKQEKKTVIFSSHIMSEVDYLSDDFVIMNKGEVIYSNTMENFRKETQKNITQEFIDRIESHNETLKIS